MEELFGSVTRSMYTLFQVITTAFRRHPFSEEGFRTTLGSRREPLNLERNRGTFTNDESANRTTIVSDI